jgi:hypothetical protein
MTYAPGFVDGGTVAAGTSKLDLSRGRYHRLTLSAATRTVNFVSGVKDTPTGQFDVPITGPSGLSVGDVVLVEIRNSSGGAVTVTFDATNVRGTPAAPANNNRKIHEFVFDGTFLTLTNAAPDSVFV